MTTPQKSKMSKVTVLAADYEPSQSDVICAKGKYSFNHPGNKRFRSIVEMTAEKYHTCKTKQDKSSIVLELVNFVRNNSNGGFIRRDSQGNWYEIGDEAAREKVGQSLREAVIRADPVKNARKKLQRAMRRAKIQQKQEHALQEPAPTHLTATTLTAAPLTATSLTAVSMAAAPLTAAHLASTPLTATPDLISSVSADLSQAPLSVPTLPSYPTLSTSAVVPIDTITGDIFDDLEKINDNWVSDSENSDLHDDLYELDELFDMPIQDIGVSL